MSNRKMIVLGLVAVISIFARTVPARADMVTATNQIPSLKALYHVNDAEANLKSKQNALAAYQNAGAGACDIAKAQAEVNEAALVLNSLNALVAYDTMLIGALPAGTPCGPSCYTQALTAQATWTDYINKVKANQAALTSSYAGQIIAANQTALINQAALAHRYAAATVNPVTAQATANWTALNLITSDRNAYAMAISYNPYCLRTW